MGIHSSAIEYPAESAPANPSGGALGFEPLDALPEVAAAAEAAAPLAQANPAARRRAQQWGLAGLLLLALAGLAAWQWGEATVAFLSDEAAIEALVERAGVWGPLAFIAINIVQVVIAPIPGYVIQLAAGYLYGPLWGGVIAAIGMLAGAMMSMLLARTFGRPLAIWMLGPERIARWEHLTHSDSPWVWLLLLAAPIGDSVFLLAGLSRVTWLTIFVCTTIVRVPTVFLSTAIGGGALTASWMVVLLILFGTLMAVAYRFRKKLLGWLELAARHQTVFPEQHAEVGEPAPVSAGDPPLHQPSPR